LQRLLGRRLTADIVGCDALGAILGDVLEQAALMRRIALHGLHQVGHEIRAPPQLHVDAAPALAHDIAHAHQVVEDQDGSKDNRGDDADDDPFHSRHLFGRGIGAASVTQ
jgi:hypothetical protein